MESEKEKRREKEKKMGRQIDRETEREREASKLENSDFRDNLNFVNSPYENIVRI